MKIKQSKKDRRRLKTYQLSLGLLDQSQQLKKTPSSLELKRLMRTSKL
jgi:hypothetical protein